MGLLCTLTLCVLCTFSTSNEVPSVQQATGVAQEAEAMYLDSELAVC